MSNTIQNPLLVVKDHLVFKPDDIYPEMLQKQSSLPIVLCAAAAKMSSAVQLNRQIFGSAIKIENVPANAVLPAKFAAIQF